MLPSYTLIRIYMATYVTRGEHGFALHKQRYTWRIYHGICYVYSVKGLLNFGESLLPPV